MTLLTYFRWRV